MEIIQDIDALGWTQKTKLVYEPIPDLCIPSEMPALKKVLPRLHSKYLLPGGGLVTKAQNTNSCLVFSPNHEEAGTLFGEAIEEQEAEGKPTAIEELAQSYLDLGLPSTVIIRSGKLGAYVQQAAHSGRDRSMAQDGLWIPAYYRNSDKVVDVTGAGNAFLGGLMAGLHLENEDIQQACLYGSVSSSYIIEQYGLPSLGKDGTWNGEDKPTDRLEAMRKRLHI